MITLADRLKELRLRNNISQNALSKKLEVTRATVNAWEMGLSYPNAQSLVELSRFFKTSVDYLLGITDNEALNINHLNSEEKEIIINLVNYFSSLHQINN